MERILARCVGFGAVAVRHRSRPVRRAGWCHHLKESWWVPVSSHSIRRVAIGLGTIIATNCSGEAATGALTPTNHPPIVTPRSAYVPFSYKNEAQKSTFEAYLACAARQGVDYQGPFSDSTGDSIFFRLAPGEHASASQRQRVERNCPQSTVGLFGTPVGHIRVGPFEQASVAFARCLRSNGSPNVPLPVFGEASPVDAFWNLPFDWSSKRFTASVTGCTEPLHDYLFAG